MANSCRLIATEYSRNYIKRKCKPVKTIPPRDRFAERIREGEIDPHIASIPTKLDEAAKQLIYKHMIDNARSTYQVSYKNPWAPQDEVSKEKNLKEKDFQSELLTYIHDLYFDPHDEKVLAPPMTAKRIFNYIRPQFLHGSLSLYQDSFGRTGATVMLEEHERLKTFDGNNKTVKKIDSCDELNNEE